MMREPSEKGGLKQWLRAKAGLNLAQHSGTVRLDSTPAGLNVPIWMGGDPFHSEQSAGLCPDRCHARWQRLFSSLFRLKRLILFQQSETCKPADGIAMGLHLSTLWEWWQWVEVHQMLEGSVRSRHVCACLCVSSTSTFCDCSVERMAWDIYGVRAALPCGWKLAVCKTDQASASGYLQNWEMGASIWAEAPPLELSFWTWVGGTGLWDWPVARYMAWTHRILSCSSSLANITVSPSFTALKKARPPSKPVATAMSVPGCAWVVCVAAKVSSLHLAVGRCSPRCNHPAAAAPAAQTFSLCSCTWRTCTDLPATRGLHLINEAHCYF